MNQALRYYQQEAVNAVLQSLATSRENVAVEIPTGGGKTPIIATLCKTFARNGYRTLVLAHRAELLSQTVDKLRVWAPETSASLYSAGLGERDLTAPVVVAGIQSIYNKADDLTRYGIIDVIIVDEAHLIPESGDGMYRTLIDALKRVNPSLNVVGLTATPYRLTSGEICGPDNILNRIVYKVGVMELVDGGFLSRLVSKAPPVDVDFDDIPIKRGEFERAKVDEACSSIVASATRDVVRYTHNRQSVLVFCSSVETANEVARQIAIITGDRDGVATIFGDTPRAERDDIIRRFSRKTLRQTLFGEQEKPVKYLVNVDVLTTGFDAPNVDCVALMRPTASPGLYYQMVGRGLRLDDGKNDCLILDFGGNLRRFGAIDRIEPTKKGKPRGDGPKQKICPRCFSALENKALFCNVCRYEFEPPNEDFLCPACEAKNSRVNRFCVSCGFELPRSARDANLDETADFNSAILSSEDRQVLYDGIQKTPIFEEAIESVGYVAHTGKSGKPCLMVNYVARSGVKISDFVCFEHSGLPRQNAIKWWVARSSYRPIPQTVAEAVAFIETAGVASPITVRYRPADASAPAKKRYPKLVSTDVPSPMEYEENVLPTYNPLNLTCENCGGKTFKYTTYGERYTATCCKCSVNVWEMSPDYYASRGDYLADVEALGEFKIPFKKNDIQFDVF